MSSRPATETDMLCEALRLAGVDVSTMTGEQIERAAAEYRRMSLSDVTAKVTSAITDDLVSRIEDLAAHQYRLRNLSPNPSHDRSRYAGAVVALDVAAEIVRGRPARVRRVA